MTYIDESEDGDNQLFFVTSYSDFEKLAHGPRGTEAKKCVYVYRFHPSDGSLVLLNVQGDSETVVNPAFSRHHPRLNVVYTCTEDCHENGKIIAYKLKADGTLEQFGEAVDAGGTSTCYLTIDKAQRNLLAVNYWNSTLVVIPMDPNTGALLGGVKNTYDPKRGKEMVACAKKDGGVNHSCNDASTISARQADPHSHALVLDPFVGQVAYVPDLGKDLVREFYYDSNDGNIAIELNVMPSGLCTGKPDGPRYFEFHPQYNIAYVVNELSSTVAVFEVDRELLNEIHAASKNGEDMNRFKGRSTLRLVQSISTIPNAFPTTMNTCGRMCVHKSGRFVIVSNRGHQSIAVFRVKTKGSKRGELQKIGCIHTRGETPRHFQFDNSGQYLLVANQDTDSIAIFNFNLSNGELKYSGNEYRVPSPNFVCCCPTHSEDEDEVETPHEYIPTTASLGDSSCDSEDSTVPAWTGRSSEENVKTELAKARAEIENLKKLLAERAK
mmetsp:Transcript_22116/g.54720  ORF Transcript_22116/g.54720 Transcript_22116/m.54720 type:complete len:496 (+) Transcript_22116:311-1798(+)